MHSFIHSFVECFFRIIFTNFRLPKQSFFCFCLEVGLQLSVLNLALLCFVLTQHLAFVTTTCFVGGEFNSQTLIKDDIFHKKTTTTFGKNSLFSRIISVLSIFASNFKWMSSPISTKGAQYFTAQNSSDSRRHFIAW